MSRQNDMYELLKNKPSDINEHFPILKEYASLCSHVTEMGTRDVVSTFALFQGKPKKMISYDLGKSPNIDFASEIAKEEGINFTFIQSDVLKVEIEPTELLFIDTKHTYRQLRRELNKHAVNVSKYIILHDTETFGKKDEFPEKSEKTGLNTAVSEFLSTDKNWIVEKEFKNNNGLTILKRLYPAIKRPKISIIIPTYNHLDDCLKPCVESIIKYTNLDNIEVIIVANGCTDGTREYVESLGHPFRLIWVDQPYGYTASTNLGIKESKGEYILLLNNDSIVLESEKDIWINMLMQPFKDDPDTGVTGPMLSNNLDIGRKFLIFFCVLIPKHLFYEIGLLDEVFNPGFNEDVDFCVKAENAGYKIVQVPDEKFTMQVSGGKTIHIGGFPIYHAGEKTLNDKPQEYKDLMTRNNKILVDRYNTRKIYDCFTFFNELDVLEIRLEELYPLVTKFILAEANLTHSGNPKPLYFQENKERFKKYLDKIEHVVVEFPDTDVWGRERFQREELIHALKKFSPNDNDMIIVSDADEIPNPKSITHYIESNIDDIAFCQQYLSYYYLNCRNDIMWHGTRITTFKNVKEIGTHNLRLHNGNRKLPHVGWHFSYLTGNEPQAVQYKIQSFGHQELNKPEYLDTNHLEKCLRDGSDMFNRKEEQFSVVNIDNTFPNCIYNNKEKYSKYIKNDRNINDVTAVVCTKNRYHTTLPHTIMSIAMQTVKPKKLLIYDDSDNREDLRDNPLWYNIFKTLDDKKIEWEIIFGQGKGQVLSHQASISKADTTWIWRMDDDNFAEPDVLEKLLSVVDEKTGAVGGCVIDPKFMTPNRLASNKIEDIYLGLNIQWFKHEGVSEVDHLYSSFIYRRKAAEHGYCMNLSPVGHREETLFTHVMTWKGWKLLVNPSAVTWHYKNAVGGIRSNPNKWMWEHDEKIFANYLSEHYIKPIHYKIIVLNNGMGDHFVFKLILPELKSKYGNNLILATCYPEVFEDCDVKQISIEEASMMCNIEEMNVYKFMYDNNWNKSMEDAYRKMYL